MPRRSDPPTPRRPTCATELFKAGKNPKQVQLWLGHHSASFTSDTYVHLLPDDLGESPFDTTPTVAAVDSEPVDVQPPIAA